MKRFGLASTATLLLLLGITAPLHAQRQKNGDQHDQQKQQDQSKQQQEHAHKQQLDRNKQRQEYGRQQLKNQNQQKHDQPQSHDEKKQGPERARQQQMEQNRQQKERAQRQGQEEKRDKRGHDQRHEQAPERHSQEWQHVQHGHERDVWQRHRAGRWQAEHRTWQQRGGYHSYRIPEDHFRGYFGENHRFRVYSLPLAIVGGYPCFQIGGFWFSVMDPWPEYWGANWYENDEVYIDYDGDGYYLHNRRHPWDRISISVSVN